MAMQQLANLDDAAAWLGGRMRLGHGAQLRTDSRQLQPGDAFIAWPGLATDGRRFVGAALAAGASACLVEQQGAQDFHFEDEAIAAMPGLKAAAGELAARLLGQPSTCVRVVAVTGTNGKTSSAWWLAQALRLLGRPCAVVGTLGIGLPPELQPSGLTTPDPVTLQHALRRFADAGVRHCAMEASSIGLAEHRLAGTQVEVAVFTNFTQDHLDYHGSMQAYWQAKRTLFAWPGLKAAVVNVDTEHGRELAAQLRPQQGLHLTTCSSRGPADLYAAEVNVGAQGLNFRLHHHEQQVQVASTVVGAYNLDNLLGVVGALLALGMPLQEAASVLPHLSGVPGRLQRLGASLNQPEVLVDYAHTPDALDKALAALRPLAQARGGRLWCVFGCGGNRDASKRPLMGAIAARGADAVVLTSDNPRHEAPAFILAQILAGIPGHDEVAVIESRREAIAHAVGQARAQDVVLIAGKGHEDYQEVAGQRLPFSDAAEGLAALRQRQGVGT